MITTFSLILGVLQFVFMSGDLIASEINIMMKLLHVSLYILNCVL